MKPSWDDAPEWANFLSMDEDGCWYWYENEPIRMGDYWDWNGRYANAESTPESKWSETLERRP